MFRRAQPFFYAFDLLWLNGKDLRSLPLVKRQARLRKLIGRQKESTYCICITSRAEDHLFFAKACELDLEGIVAKWTGTYIVDNRRSTWVKIKNPSYSQRVERVELFQPR